MKCENCSIEHNGKYGSGRFCGSKCARGFSTKALRHIINEKVSDRCRNREPSWYLQKFKEIKYEDVFSKNSVFKSNARILLYAKANSIVIDECLHIDWNGALLVKQLHHKNGISSDYRKENLQLLCPNCHSQTETFCRGLRNKQKETNRVFQLRKCGMI